MLTSYIAQNIGSEGKSDSIEPAVGEPASKIFHRRSDVLYILASANMKGNLPVQLAQNSCLVVIAVRPHPRAFKEHAAQLDFFLVT